MCPRVIDDTSVSLFHLRDAGPRLSEPKSGPATQVSQFIMRSAGVGTDTERANHRTIHGARMTEDPFRVQEVLLLLLLLLKKRLNLACLLSPSGI